MLLVPIFEVGTVLFSALVSCMPSLLYSLDIIHSLTSRLSFLIIKYRMIRTIRSLRTSPGNHHHGNRFHKNALDVDIDHSTTLQPFLLVRSDVANVNEDIQNRLRGKNNVKELS